MEYQCKCGYTFPEDLGKYGCPNCEGENKVKLMTKETRGGARENAGRKPIYNEPTKHVTFVIPISQIDKVKQLVKDYLLPHKK